MTPRRPLLSTTTAPPPRSRSDTRRAAGTTPVLLSLHGVRASVLFGDPRVAAVAADVLGPLLNVADEARSNPVEGAVLPYRESEVLRHVSADAVRLEGGDPLLEIYRDGGERFWRVDERWGMCEVNLLKRTWRSWILPEPACDDVRLFEASVLWPMAQLARGAGLHLIQATAVGRDGRGVLILSPFGLAPELAALAGDRVGVIGQRWTAMREAPDGRVSLLSVPGRSQLSPAPRLSSAGVVAQPTWADLAAGNACESATCELVLIVEPMRRQQCGVTALPAAVAREQLNRLWPTPLLSAGRTATSSGVNPLISKLVRSSTVHRVRLSHDGGDLARLLVRPATRPLRAAA